LNLFRECFKRGYSKDQIRGLVKFIDWVINLPTKYQDKLYHEIIKLEEETKMPYLPTWERTAKKEGKKEGKKEQALKTAKKMLEDDFSIENIMKYTGLSQKEIKALMN
jgi:predicted transposase/invertase (TIGR01784 family)